MSVPGVGIAQVISTWPKPALEDKAEWDRYREAYLFLLEAYAEIFANAPKPTSSYAHIKRAEDAYWQYRQDCWELANPLLSQFCSDLIKSEITPEALLELKGIYQTTQLMIEDFLYKGEAA